MVSEIQKEPDVFSMLITDVIDNREPTISCGLGGVEFRLEIANVSQQATPFYSTPVSVLGIQLYVLFTVTTSKPNNAGFLSAYLEFINSGSYAAFDCYFKFKIEKTSVKSGGIPHISWPTEGKLTRFVGCFTFQRGDTLSGFDYFISHDKLYLLILKCNKQ